MPKNNLTNITDEDRLKIDDLLIRGDRENALAEIARHLTRPLSLKDKISIAEWYNRLHEPLLALKSLQHWIRIIDRDPNGRKDIKRVSEIDEATNESIARLQLAYGTSLFHLGAIDSAKRVLSKIDERVLPESLLYLSGVYSFQWNYQKSIEVLTRLLTTKDLGLYKASIAQVNLIAALIAMNQMSEAKVQLKACLNLCIKEGFQVLVGNLHELRSQIAIFENDPILAIEYASLALEKFSAEKSLYHLFASKWKAIAQATLEQTASSRHFLHQVGQKAEGLGHWNTIRDCHLFEGIIFNDENLIGRAYFGTSSENFKSRVRNLYNGFHADEAILTIDASIPQGALRYGSLKISNTNSTLGIENEAKSKLFSPLEPYCESGERLLDKKLFFNIYCIFLKDFYEPRTLGQLFEGLYPTEQFNHETSPQRVMKVIDRFNAWLDNQGVPIQIKIKKSEFEIYARSPLKIQISNSWLNQDLTSQQQSMQLASSELLSERMRLQSFSRHCLLPSFTAQDFADFEKSSLSTAKRTLSKLTDAGAIQRIGSRRSTRYQIKIA